MKFFLTKSILLKDYENAFKKKYSYMSQGPPNPGFMQEKVQKGDFRKKPWQELIFFVVLGSYESLEGAWNTKLEAASFLMSKILYKQCE